MQGVHEDYGFVMGNVVNGWGRRGTKGDDGGRQGTAGDGMGLRVTTSNSRQSQSL